MRFFSARNIFLVGLGLTLFATLPCVADTPPGAAQWTDQGYVNRYPLPPFHSNFLQWQLVRWLRDDDELDGPAPQTVAADLARVQHPGAAPQVTWIGHSSVLLQLDGVNILMDPVFSDHIGPWSPLGPKRLQPPGLRLSDLPHIDVVLISHNHYDHMDRPSLRGLARQSGGPPLFLVPLGDDRWLVDNVPGLSTRGPHPSVRGMNWDEQHIVAGHHSPIEIHFDAVQHWSTRTLLDENQTLWGSWAILHPRFRFWFSGDLGHSRDTLDIGRKYGHFDLAAIAIGSYKPRWYMKRFHIDPDEAVQVEQEVNARQALGIHWGTFLLGDEAPDDPPRDLSAALQRRGLPAARFFVLKPGETRVFTGSGEPVVQSVTGGGRTRPRRFSERPLNP